jgi:serine/threonine protein kinase
MTAADLTLGTASYLAPEQARNAEVGPAADIYSLGLVLLEALTGVRCFSGDTHEALAARLSTSPSIPHGLPAPWPDLLAAMTASDPTLRPTAAQIASSLQPEPSPSALPVAVGRPFAGGDVPAPAIAVGTAPHADGDVVTSTRAARHRATGTWVALLALACAAVLAGTAYLLIGDTGANSGGSTPAPPARQHSLLPSATHHHRSTHPAADLGHIDPRTTAARHPSRTHLQHPGRTHSPHAGRSRLAPAPVAASNSAPLTTPAPSPSASPTPDPTSPSSAPSTTTTPPAPPSTSTTAVATP